MSACDNGVYDIIIIGAGPCGLAAAARLCEPTPSSLFTDAEHERFYWARKHKLRSSTISKHGATRPPKSPLANMYTDESPRPRSPYSMLALDATAGHWCGHWDSRFEAFEISHLRSPMFFHPDPRDCKGLLTYARSLGRENELVEIRNVVGKEQSKHKTKARYHPCGCKAQKRNSTSDFDIDERDRMDYYKPSSALFSSFCRDIVARYQLGNVVQQAEVRSLRYGPVEDLPIDERIFTVETSNGTKYARIVILALGPGGKPFLPRQLSFVEREGACHSSQMTPKDNLPSHVMEKIKKRIPTNVAVVGGGLTSSQVVDMLLQKGVQKIWYIMRSGLKVRDFDLDLSWVAKYNNRKLSAFWGAEDDDERLEIMRKARDGGSLNPTARKILNSHIDRGRVSLHTYTNITSQQWDPQQKTWSLETEPPCQFPPIDHMYFATGVVADFDTLPIVQQLRTDVLIPTKGGLPCLTEELMVAEDVPCFVTGRLAGLRLGPWAANLEGARAGAERITWKIQDLLGSGNELRNEHPGALPEVPYNVGLANPFDALQDFGTKFEA